MTDAHAGAVPADVPRPHGVGVHQLRGAPRPFPAATRLFTFVGANALPSRP